MVDSSIWLKRLWRTAISTRLTTGATERFGSKWAWAWNQNMRGSFAVSGSTSFLCTFYCIQWTSSVQYSGSWSMFLTRDIVLRTVRRSIKGFMNCYMQTRQWSDADLKRARLRKIGFSICCAILVQSEKQSSDAKKGEWFQEEVGRFFHWCRSISVWKRNIVSEGTEVPAREGVWETYSRLCEQWKTRVSEEASGGEHVQNGEQKSGEKCS